jgi:hypothetical protein
MRTEIVPSTITNGTQMYANGTQVLLPCEVRGLTSRQALGLRISYGSDSSIHLHWHQAME